MFNNRIACEFFFNGIYLILIFIKVLASLRCYDCQFDPNASTIPECLTADPLIDYSSSNVSWPTGLTVKTCNRGEACAKTTIGNLSYKRNVIKVINN